MTHNQNFSEENMLDSDQMGSGKAHWSTPTSENH